MEERQVSKSYREELVQISPTTEEKKERKRGALERVDGEKRERKREVGKKKGNGPN